MYKNGPIGRFCLCRRSIRQPLPGVRGQRSAAHAPRRRSPSESPLQLPLQQLRQPFIRRPHPLCGFTYALSLPGSRRGRGLGSPAQTRRSTWVRRTPRPATASLQPKLIRWAKVHPAHVRRPLGLDSSRWYPVIERPPGIPSAPLPGYVWPDDGGRYRQVWPGFLETIGSQEDEE